MSEIANIAMPIMGRLVEEHHFAARAALERDEQDSDLVKPKPKKARPERPPELGQRMIRA
jgi:hypothetical protein